jgi:hypothetical protein
VNQASVEVLLKGKGRIEEVERQRILRTRYSVLLTDGHFPIPLVNFEALLLQEYSAQIHARRSKAEAHRREGTPCRVQRRRLLGPV